jgi:hypothetical protein
MTPKNILRIHRLFDFQQPLVVVAPEDLLIVLFKIRVLKASEISRATSNSSRERAPTSFMYAPESGASFFIAVFTLVILLMHSISAVRLSGSNCVKVANHPTSATV